MVQMQVEVPEVEVHTSGMIAILFPRNDWTAWELGEQLWLSTKWGDRSTLRRFPQHLPPTRNVEKISRAMADQVDIVIFLSVDVPPSRWDRFTREILRWTKGKLLFAVAPDRWRKRILDKLLDLRGDLSKVEFFALEDLEDLDRLALEARKRHHDLQWSKAIRILVLLGLLWWTFQER